MLGLGLFSAFIFDDVCLVLICNQSVANQSLYYIRCARGNRSYITFQVTEVLTTSRWPVRSGRFVIRGVTFLNLSSVIFYTCSDFLLFCSVSFVIVNLLFNFYKGYYARARRNVSEDTCGVIITCVRPHFKIHLGYPFYQEKIKEGSFKFWSCRITTDLLD